MYKILFNSLLNMMLVVARLRMMSSPIPLPSRPRSRSPHFPQTEFWDSGDITLANSFDLAEELLDEYVRMYPMTPSKVLMQAPQKVLLATCLLD